ncbi:MAG: prepilin-type N-terminal cleavage/methylation domain-containing protein [Planctomycetes bacterium]|nr:prepilin-type N-terminal cleavage/methylation domain-containing protein [Planctomycetota bacterium]
MRCAHGGRSSSAGFTLLEMLVVVAIIIVVSTMSLAFLSLFSRGQSVKEGARIVQAAFAECRQMAAAKRQVHFIHFPMFASSNGNVYDRMVFFADSDVVLSNKGVCNKPNGNGAGDRRDEREIFLPKSVQFLNGSPPTSSVFNSPMPGGPQSYWPYLGFRPDGTIQLPVNSSVQDKSMNNPATSTNGTQAKSNADIVLFRPAGPEFMAMDFVLETGKIRRMCFFKQ